MAVASTDVKVAVSIKLNIGATSTGEVKTKSVNLGKLSLARYDDQKALNIIEPLAEAFTENVYRIERTKVSSISEE